MKLLLNIILIGYFTFLSGAQEFDKAKLNLYLDIPSFQPAKEVNIDFNTLEGQYTSKDIPLDIKNNNLRAQANGQPAFMLNYVENKFKHGIFPEKSKIILVQNGKEYLYFTDN